MQTPDAPQRAMGMPPGTAATLDALPPEQPTGPRWQVPAADFRALALGPVLCELADHGVITLSGADAVSFLQAQTSADIAAMGASTWQPGGYCTPKGRLLAIFEAWRGLPDTQGNADLHLLLPAELAAETARRLAMYVLRAKVKLRVASEEWSVLGVCGTGAARALGHAGLALPAADWECLPLSTGDGARIARLPASAACPERYLLVLPRAALPAWRERLAGVADLRGASAALWRWSQVQAALPAIFASTRECFVPQTVNLEVLGGVNFRKGCYPGQEIVARSQYLGKLRRRMALAHAAALGPGADIFQGDPPQAVGRIVMAASAPQGGWDLLFECPSDVHERGSLHAGAADAPALRLQPLPYVLFDPTA